MARTPVSWDPNRYGAVRYEYKLDSTTGNYSIVEKEHDYTGVTYNFTPLVTTPPVTAPQVPIQIHNKQVLLHSNKLQKLLVM